MGELSAGPLRGNLGSSQQTGLQANGGSKRVIAGTVRRSSLRNEALAGSRFRSRIRSVAPHGFRFLGYLLGAASSCPFPCSRTGAQALAKRSFWGQLKFDFQVGMILAEPFRQLPQSLQVRVGQCGYSVASIALRYFCGRVPRDFEGPIWLR